MKIQKRTGDVLKHLNIISNGRTLSILIDRLKTYIFDLAGRPLVLTHDGRTFVRGLDGRIKEKTWKGSVDNFDRIIRDLNEGEIRHLTTELYKDLEAAQAHIAAGRDYDFQMTGENKKNDFVFIDKIFSRLLYWSPDQLAQDVESFHRIYQPVNILPPDQYFCVPLQVVEGCPWNKCTFCNFYRGRKFRIRPLEEIDQHIQKVKTFFGESLALRRSLFLCDANAFAMGSGDLLEVLSYVGEHFPHQMGPDGGISSFADIPAILGKTKEDLVRFVDRGLRRVYVGMETGSDEVRKLVHKPGQQEQLIRAVTALKEAGLSVGLILLLGVGGEEFEKMHIKESSAAIKKMGLGPRDIVYFSPFQPSSSTDYFYSPETVYLTPLNKDGIRNQYLSLMERLNFFNHRKSPLTAIYDIREFVV